MYRKLIFIFILTIFTNTQEGTEPPTHSHLEELERLLKVYNK